MATPRSDPMGLVVRRARDTRLTTDQTEFGVRASGATDSE